MAKKEFTAEEAAKVARSLGIDLAAEGIELEKSGWGSASSSSTEGWTRRPMSATTIP
jgi:hypothetical protein